MKVILKVSGLKNKEDANNARILVKRTAYSKIVRVSLLKKEITFYPIFNTYDIQAIRFVLQKDGFTVEDVDER